MRKQDIQEKSIRVFLYFKILFFLFISLTFVQKGNAQGANVGVRIGDKCPELVFYTTNGTTKKLSDYNGQTVLIHFWSMESDTCLKSVPELQRLMKKYGRFMVIGVNDGMANEDSLKAFSERNKLLYPLVLDRNSFLYHKMSNGNKYGFPYNVFIDKKGMVMKMNATLAEVEAYLEKGNILNFIRKKKSNVKKTDE